MVHLRSLSSREQPGTYDGEDGPNQQPGPALRVELTSIARQAPRAGDEECDREERKDVFRGHVPSSHFREQALLAPGRRAGVEQRRAGVEEAEIVGSEDALALVAVLEDVDAMLARDRRAHEVAGALLEP